MWSKIAIFFVIFIVFLAPVSASYNASYALNRKAFFVSPFSDFSYSSKGVGALFQELADGNLYNYFLGERYVTIEKQPVDGNGANIKVSVNKSLVTREMVLPLAGSCSYQYSYDKYCDSSWWYYYSTFTDGPANYELRYEFVDCTTSRVLGKGRLCVGESSPYHYRPESHSIKFKSDFYDCPSGCKSEYIGDPCQGVTCASDFCHNGDRYYSGTCQSDSEHGVCTYSVEACPNKSCTNGLCITNDCGANGCQAYCEGNRLWSQGSCSHSQCYYNTYTDCTYGCDSSTKQCKSAPCANDCSSGQTRCSGSYSQTCGNYDSDSCYDWPSSTSGSGNTFCSNGCNSSTGTCYGDLSVSITPVNLTVNSGVTQAFTASPSGGAGSYSYSWSLSSYTDCTTSGSTSSTYSVTCTNTGSTQISRTVSATVTSSSQTKTASTALYINPSSTCTSECSSGQTMCNGSYAQTCGNYDSDSCLEWPSSISGFGNTYCTYDCSNGQCIGAPECTSGSCCDTTTNKFRPSTYICENAIETEFGCPWGTSPGDDVEIRYKDRYCSGSSAQCDGITKWGNWYLKEDCSSNAHCILGKQNCERIPDWFLTWWSDLIKDEETSGTVKYSQSFSWNSQNLTKLKSMNVDYQWELRRDKDYWDYTGYNKWSESKDRYYWTNLPKSTDKYSEENDSGDWVCYVRSKIGFQCDEEFEVKSEDVSSIIADHNYHVKVLFVRKNPGLSMRIHSESEYCGKGQWCYDPFYSLTEPYFDWNIMAMKDVVS